MNNIIEKLGITKAPWKLKNMKKSSWFDGYSASIVSCNEEDEVIDDGSAGGEYAPASRNKNDLQLIKSSPEILKALINSTIELINYSYSEIEARYSRIESKEDVLRRAELMHEDNIKIVEKATGKSWEEIKGFIDESV